MIEATIEKTLEEADAALAEAERLRKFYRRRMKRTNDLRCRHLTAAFEELVRISVPMRSIMGRLPYLTISEALEERLRATSAQLQSERRKLRKMLPLTD